MSRLALALALAALSLSCASAEAPPPDADTPPTSDAGSPTDAGTEPDAGTPLDAGMEPDAGTPPDAGTDPTPGAAIQLRIPVPGGSFESAPGESNGLGYGWSMVANHPTEAVVAMVAAGTAGETVAAYEGSRALRIESRRTDAAPPVGEVSIRSAPIITISPGHRYTLEAWIYNDASCMWTGAGPEIGFVAGSDSLLTAAPVANLPSGQWTKATAEFTPAASQAGTSLLAQIRVKGNALPECWPRVLIDAMTVTVDVPGSFPVANGSFEAPAAAAADTLPEGWALFATSPADAIARVARTPDDSLSFTPPTGDQVLRLASTRAFQPGVDTGAPHVRITSPVVTTAVAGRTYTAYASFLDPDSCMWSGSGPSIGFDVGGKWNSNTSGYVSILGMKGNGPGRFLGAAFAWTAGSNDAGKELRVVLDVFGNIGSGCRPDILIDDVRVGSTL
jgi:hypothetical protein